MDDIFKTWSWLRSPHRENVRDPVQRPGAIKKFQEHKEKYQEKEQPMC